ncbi:DUF6941 family protein [Tumebacillus permanentifrigoris]|uniref:Uncharacterized protein n=1 Tax=Tumebacillus permanentifrigoris TaxID=378543 RepID=A0A316D591_9BACL|nr:hypothetical protein [Tumebacillus permanentifrigoris]PWK07487.1 hypothetical protein C7459_11786 [Tumebacillus permanentifrigoris]
MNLNLLSMLLCDEVEPTKDRTNIYGIFRSLTFQSLPNTYTFTLAVELDVVADGSDQFLLKVLVKSPNDEILKKGEGPVILPPVPEKLPKDNKMVVTVGLAYSLKNIQLSEEGMYSVELFDEDDELVGSSSFLVGLVTDDDND